MYHQNLSLSLEQEFQVKVMEIAAQNMSRQQLLNLLLQSSRSLMLKDNIIRALIETSVEEAIY